MTTITIHMSLRSTASQQLQDAIHHTKAVAVSGLVTASALFYDQMRNRHGRHIAGINGRLRRPRRKQRSDRTNSRAAASIRASFAFGVTVRDDFEVCHRRPCLASALTDGKTTEIACQVRFVLGNDPKVLIVASSRTTFRNWRRLPGVSAF